MRLAFPDLTSRPFQCVAGGENRRVVLKTGNCYELRTNAPVLVRPGQGTPRQDVDTEVIPEAPLWFRADVDTITLSASTGSDATVWLREVTSP